MLDVSPRKEKNLANVNIYGREVIESESSKMAFFLKCIVNNSAAAFFPGTVQHRDLKVGGLSYEDDYRGNALAATITPGAIDVRFHAEYADPKVRQIFECLLADPALRRFSEYSVRYQGRELISASEAQG